MSPRPLAIVGAGGHGREACAVVSAVNRVRPTWELLGVLDDSPADLDALTRLGVKLLGPLHNLATLRADHVVAIGDPAARAAVVQRVDTGSAAATLVHPSADIGDDVEIGAGSMVYAGAVCTTNVRLGLHTHVNCRAVVSHDCRVGDYVAISPGALLNGAVTVGDRAFIGAGATVLPGCHIGADAVVAAGAVVISDVSDGRTVMGTPAR